MIVEGTLDQHPVPQAGYIRRPLNLLGVLLKKAVPTAIMEEVFLYINNAYLRPNGRNIYFRPDGISFYIRPN